MVQEEQSDYAEAVKMFPPEATHKPIIIILQGDRMIMSDQSHGPHDEEHPDDGSTSAFALKLAEKLKEFGIESNVRRLD